MQYVTETEKMAQCLQNESKNYCKSKFHSEWLATDHTIKFTTKKNILLKKIRNINIVLFINKIFFM